MSSFAGVLALYALAVGIVVGAFASLYVPLLAVGGPGPLLVWASVFTFLGAFVLVLLFELRRDPGEEHDDRHAVGRGRPALAPFVFALVVGGGALLAAEIKIVVPGAVGAVPPAVVEAAVSTLALLVVVVVTLPIAARRAAWQHVEATLLDAEDADDRPADDESSVVDLGDALDQAIPDRVTIRRLDARHPAVYTFDDGYRAVIGFTSGALEVLSDDEREALVARETTRVVQRSAAGPFWASALALGVTNVLDLVTIDPYDSRAAGKVRLPYWFVAPLKSGAVVVPFLLLSALYFWAFESFFPVSGVTLAAAYAMGVPWTGFGLERVAAGLARRQATTGVLAADEHGALLADDSLALASALRTLHEASNTGQGDRGDGTQPAPVGNALEKVDALADCPTNRVPLDERTAALETLHERLEDGSATAGRDRETQQTLR